VDAGAPSLDGRPSEVLVPVSRPALPSLDLCSLIVGRHACDGFVPRSPGGRLVSTALLLAVVVLAGCEMAGSGPPVGGTAVVVYPTSPRVANPLVAADAYSLEVARSLLFLPLLEYGSDLSASAGSGSRRWPGGITAA
jgi:hypothetical protein